MSLLEQNGFHSVRQEEKPVGRTVWLQILATKS